MTQRYDKSAGDLTSPRISDISLAKLLVKLGLLEAAHAERQKYYPEFAPIAHFAHLGHLDEEKAIHTVAQHLKTDFYTAGPTDPDRIGKLLEKDPLSNVALNFWKKIRAVPIGVTAHDVTIAMANPLDLEAIRELERDLQRRVRVLVGQESEIIALLSRTIELKDALDFHEFINDAASSNTSSTTDPAALESTLTQEDISAPMVVRLVNKILAGAILKGASDLHISPGNGCVQVRVRIDGIMRDLMEIPHSYKNAILSRIKVLCGMDITEKRHPQDARLRLKSSQGVRDLRISTVPTVHGENVVARILSTDIGKVKLDRLGMNEAVQKRFRKVLRTTSKINLICGPTGSGKTSTLYAAILDLRDGTQNIITIEDPIEHRITGVNQIQVSPKIDLTFAKALRAVLRQDPDIIMVGEIRDSETATTAIQVAQTGHIVLSTIHTNTAVGAVTRLRDLGVPPFLIASSVGSIIAQRLVRLLCKNCARQLKAEEIETLQQRGIVTSTAKGAEGCDLCDKSGYRGRLGVFSFLEITPEIACAIREERGEDIIEQMACTNTFESLERAAIRMIEDGSTTLTEVERVMGPLENHIIGVNRTGTAEDALQKGIIRRRVLVVDDDEAIRTVYKMLLEKHMFHVEEAANGIEALDAIYRDPPALILLDLMMPKMNGVEVIETLRSNPQTRDIPILLLTAAATEENELKMLQKGANDFVSKTAKSEILLARVSRLLDRLR